MRPAQGTTLPLLGMISLCDMFPDRENEFRWCVNPLPDSQRSRWTAVVRGVLPRSAEVIGVWRL